MRDTIRQAIINAETSVGSRVFQPNIADKDTQKPYAVVKFAGDYEGNIRSSFNRYIEVWVYIERSDYNDMDSIVDDIYNTLHEKDLVTSNGVRFSISCNQISADGFNDPDLEAFTKTLTFTQPLIKL